MSKFNKTKKKLSKLIDLEDGRSKTLFSGINKLVKLVHLNGTNKKQKQK